jgi:predicted AAA+ superfamily ATPase
MIERTIDTERISSLIASFPVTAILGARQVGKTTLAKSFSTYSGTELDLFWEQEGKHIGMEIKYADAPRLTPSMKHAREDLDLDMLLVIYPGDLSYKLDKNIVVLPFIKMYEGLPEV